MRLAILALLATLAAPAAQPFLDRSHFSKVFNEERRYRILLPPGYEASGKSYPVIYYFHGHSDRYTVELYDKGTETIPKMVDFVARHDVIVVCPDGYVARDYTGFYGGSPYDVMSSGGDMDFGRYFLELTAHIDATYRTLTDRRHRGTSGLSMGGFMSLWLSARFPDKIGSASAFNPAPEMFTGDKGRRSLWRAKDHTGNHGQTMIRLVHASGDYIGQYHEEMRDVYARALNIDFEYRRDEYHRHWATSIAETFEFHMRAFDNPALDNVPETFSYDDPYREFQAWGWQVRADGETPGFTCLDGVRQGGFRVTTRRWAPDGPSIPGRAITVTAPPIYRAGARYTVRDHSLKTGETAVTEVTVGADGRLTLKFDGAGHQVSFSGPGTGAEPPLLLPVTSKDTLRFAPNADVALPVRVYNPRGDVMKAVRAELSSEYPTVKIVASSCDIPEIAPGKFADLSGRLKASFIAGAGYYAPARLHLKLTFDGWHETSEDIDILIAPETMAAPAAIEILDGRTVTLHVFRQKGNQGGGSGIERTVTEGKGNGNGILEPGEEATIWVKLPQGMDPFDKGNWYRTKIRTDSPYIEEIGDIQELKQLEWTGAQERTSLIRLSPSVPAGTAIPLVLDNESWSYYFTPDVRFGREKLYQARQLHTRHLHRYEIKAGKR